MLAVFGFVFMGPAILTLLPGGIEYVERRAIVVFAPFGVAIGLTMMLVAVRLEILERRGRRPDRRIARVAMGLAELED